MAILETLSRRRAGQVFTTFIDVYSNHDPQQAGMLALLQRNDGSREYVHERNFIDYQRLHTMLNDDRFKNNPIVERIDPNSRIALKREWGAFEQARRAILQRRQLDPYAGVPASDIARVLFTRLRSGISPLPHKAGKPDGPS